MSFIYNYFFNSNNATPLEKENAVAVKAMLKDRKSALKAEYREYELEYKQAIHEAEIQFKRAKDQAQEAMYRQVLSAVHREVDAVLMTEAYRGSDAKTKNKVEGIRAWMAGAESKLMCRKQEYYGVEREEDDGDNEMLKQEQGYGFEQDQKHPDLVAVA
ncbi:hypothetical protein EDD11_005754 [Mortierella claussenii]|nr:hypothetical protein EDD11_005754 [Mortierella claussenii]